MLKVAYHHIFVFLITSIVEVAAMLFSDDGFSLLNCVKPDGSLDIERALECLNDVEDEHRIDDVSLFSCVNAEGGLDVAKFVQMQEDSSLLELSIFMEAGLIDNSGTPMLTECGLIYHAGHIRHYMKSGMGVLSAKQ